MNLVELLAVVAKTASDNGVAQPFMVGGVPRDRIIGVRGKKNEIKDVDITTGDKDAIKLAALLAGKLVGSRYRTYDDGHASLDYRGLHLDFSSNFIAPGVEAEIKKRGKKVDPMMLELYSRDFTMNTLLESLDFSAIYDLTEEGIGDIQAGVIKCPVDPKITIGNDPRRILRAIRFSIKYDMKLDDQLKRAMLNHKEDIQKLPTKFLQDKANEIVRLDDERGIEMLIEFKLLPLIPLTKTLSDMLIQKRQLMRAL